MPHTKTHRERARLRPFWEPTFPFKPRAPGEPGRRSRQAVGDPLPGHQLARTHGGHDRRGGKKVWRHALQDMEHQLQLASLSVGATLDVNLAVHMSRYIYVMICLVCVSRDL